ncbi:hypothetical protein Tco_1573407 [Tanacetum coccineum]
MTPRVVLLKSGLKPLSTARPVYTAQPKPTVQSARPMTYFSKQAQSIVQRPFYKKTTLTNRHFNQKVNTARSRVVNTARPYRAPVNTVRENRFNVVKPSACWVWKPIRPNGASLGKPQMNDKGFVDSGCSRHMTGMSKEVGPLRYLSLLVPLKKVGDEAVHKELGERMERAATTASSLEAEHDSGNIK